MSCYFRVDERVILMIALFISAFAYFGMLPMTDEPPKVASLGIKDYLLDSLN